jgi:hypothetical protein
MATEIDIVWTVPCSRNDKYQAVYLKRDIDAAYQRVANRLPADQRSITLHGAYEDNRIYLAYVEHHCDLEGPGVSPTYQLIKWTFCPNIQLVKSAGEIAFSFPHGGGSIDRYEVQLLNAAQQVIRSVSVSVITPVIAGAFTDLGTMNTTGFTVKAIPFAGNFSQINCPGTPVTNIPPTANAGPDQSIQLPADAALAGSGNDPDGTIIAYQWSQVSGPNNATFTAPNDPNTNVTDLTDGTYIFRLTVTDNDMAQGNDSMQLTVIRPNLPPTADAGPDQTLKEPTNTATLNGSGSTDPDGTIVGYFWAQVDGPAGASIQNPNQAITLVTGLVPGTYTFSLTVTDNHGATGYDTTQIFVATNQPPNVNAGPDQTLGLPQNYTTLQGSASDPDGTIVSSLWEQVSGPNSANIVNPNQLVTDVNAMVAGTYVFKLTATDDGGKTGEDFVAITVNHVITPWVPNTVVCETDNVFTLAKQVTGLSSPTALLYDAPTGRIYVADLDNINGNIYSFDPDNFNVSSDVTYVPGYQDTIYMALPDPIYRRMFIAGPRSGGWKVLDIASGTYSTLPFGQDQSGQPFNRISGAMLDTSIIGIDADEFTLTVYQRDNLQLVVTTPINNIPSGDTYVAGAPIFNQVGSELWVVSSQTAQGQSVARYSADFSTLIGTISFASYTATWDGAKYWRTAFYDADNHAFYIWDAGKSNLIVINTTNNSIATVIPFTNRMGKSGGYFPMVQDPITKELFLTGFYGNSTTDANQILKTFRINRTNFTVEYSIRQTAFNNLIQQATLNSLWGAFPGQPVWSGAPGWNTDGIISKYTR